MAFSLCSYVYAVSLFTNLSRMSLILFLEVAPLHVCLVDYLLSRWCLTIKEGCASRPKEQSSQLVTFPLNMLYSSPDSPHGGSCGPHRLRPSGCPVPTQRCQKLCERCRDQRWRARRLMPPAPRPFLYALGVRSYVRKRQLL